MPYTGFMAAGGLDVPTKHSRRSRDAAGAGHPLGKPITAEDCAAAAVYLCSDAAANVTGVLLPIDGGYVAKMSAATCSIANAYASCSTCAARTSRSSAATTATIRTPHGTGCAPKRRYSPGSSTRSPATTATRSSTACRIRTDPTSRRSASRRATPRTAIPRCSRRRRSRSTSTGAPSPLNSMLSMGGTQHRRYRSLVQPSFVPAKAQWWMQNWIEQTVNLLIDSFIDEGRAELNVDFCAAIPVLTITGSFGVPVEQALDIRAALPTARGRHRHHPADRRSAPRRRRRTTSSACSCRPR